MSDRKVELVDLEGITDCVDDLRELLTEGSMMERRTFIRGFVKELEVTGNEVVLNYTMPLLPDNLNVEKEVVPPIVHLDGRWLTVHALLFDKKHLIPALQQLPISSPRSVA